MTLKCDDCDWRGDDDDAADWPMRERKKLEKEGKKLAELRFAAPPLSSLIVDVRYPYVCRLPAELSRAGS